ncbi:MAG: flavin reductase family protein [Candidatus Obscuribacterales bacterium]|nr:flavin reductase family protein [Candidatus Obscuribacterales bacterium]
MIIDCTDETSHDIYKVLLGCVVPRPIAWVSSQSLNETLNLAPFSFFNVFSAEPPIVGLGIGMKTRKDSAGQPTVVPKDTLANIIDTEQFVINVVSFDLADRMNSSSGEYEPGVSEFEATGLTPAQSTKVKPPRVAEAKVSMECKLFQRIELPRSNIVLGEIVCIHIDDAVWHDDSIDVRSLQPIGRLSGSAYCKVDSIFDMPRPRV